MATHTGCFARIEELEAMLEIAKDGLTNILELSPNFGDKKVARETLDRLNCFSGLESDAGPEPLLKKEET